MSANTCPLCGEKFDAAECPCHWADYKRWLDSRRSAPEPNPAIVEDEITIVDEVEEIVVVAEDTVGIIQLPPRLPHRPLGA